MALALADIVANLADVDTAGTTKTVDLPEAGVTAGDMMCVAIGHCLTSGDAPDDMSTPTDWTQALSLGLPDTGTTPRLYFYWIEVPGGGLGSSVDFISASAGVTVSVAFAITSADVTALDVLTSDVGTSASIDCPAATASNTGGLIIRVGCSDDDDQSSQPAMASHTAVNWIETAAAGNGCSVYVWAAVQPSTSVGAASATIVSEEWGAATIVIAEPGGGPGGIVVPAANHYINLMNG